MLLYLYPFFLVNDKNNNLKPRRFLMMDSKFTENLFIVISQIKYPNR